MLRGIYTSATGMVAEMNRENVIANNLANVNTVGFKKDNVVVSQFAELFLNAYSKRGIQPVGNLGLGVQADTEYPDYSNGPIQVTGNATDLALRGDGLFAIQAKNGVRFSRAGNFMINQDGYLVNQDGYNVLGQNGPIRIGEGKFQISDAGDVIQNGEVLDRLQIFSEGGMVKEGNYQYNTNQAVPSTDYKIVQGALEQSNINTVSEMVRMITATRAYETNQKALTAHDETLGKVINDMMR